MSAITAALSGLLASVAEVTASASNIANAQTVGPLASSSKWGASTTVGSGGGPGSSSGASPGSTWQAYQPVTTVQTTNADGGVQASTVAVTPATQAAYDPESPFANAQGLVAAPNVGLTAEATNQMSALVAYQANLATLRAADQMQSTVLAIA
jgi:flagellar basal-body rod protein FlgC